MASAELRVSLTDDIGLVETVKRKLSEMDCVIFSIVKARWDTLDLSTSKDW